MSQAMVSDKTDGMKAALNGRVLNGMTMETIVEECQGCERAEERENGTFCKNFPVPSAKWRRGVCNMATHKKAEAKNGGQAKVRVGQQKQKKKK